MRQLLLPSLLCLLLVAAGVACGDPTGPVPTGIATPGANGHFEIGQQARIGTYILTVNRVFNEDNVQGVAPATGMRFLVLDLTIQNIDTDNVRMSPAAQLTIKDSTGTEYDMDGDVTPTTGLTTTSLPDTVPAEGMIHGEIAYQVPLAAHGFLLYFNPSFLLSLFSHGNQLTFDLQ
jgi:Domain of unknown function (DUF4352)